MTPTPRTESAIAAAARRMTRRFRSLSRLVATLALLAPVACKKGGSSSTFDPRRQDELVASSAPNLIVVLGSSTSAGVGPTDPSEAWVPRYARYLAEKFPAFGVRSLAVGGQTTYHIQASDFVPPAGRPTPTLGRNLTAALALRPRALLVNMPSNDAAERYSVAEQLANFERVSAAAEAARVPLWVTTTQPRNFGDETQLRIQVEVRDAISRRFGPRAMDLWTPFATPTRKLASRFDAGDGTHLNGAGHAVIFERVVAAGIPQSVAP